MYEHLFVTVRVRFVFVMWVLVNLDERLFVFVRARSVFEVCVFVNWTNIRSSTRWDVCVVSP